MPSYSTNLKTWGSSGTEYPNNYNYVEGEQPVDAWDNFFNSNVVSDIEHLISVTNNELLARDGSVNLQADLSDDQANTIYDYSKQRIGDGLVKRYKGNDIDSDGDGTVDAADNGVKADTIMLWSGTIANIPSGYVLCDGNNNTPDLQDRFVVGAGNTYSVDDTGGSKTHTLTESELASHTHTFDGGNLTDTGNANPSLKSSSTSSSHTTNTTGGDSAHENRPPYYALAYIMKV